MHPMLLLPQVYMIGQGVAEMGTAEQLQPSSNASRAIASMVSGMQGRAGCE